MKFADDTKLGGESDDRLSGRAATQRDSGRLQQEPYEDQEGQMQSPAPAKEEQDRPGTAGLGSSSVEEAMGQ